MIRVLIADDHPIVRKGLVQILSHAPDIQVSAEVSSAPELLEALAHTPVDVLVMDIGMPGRSGLDILPEVCRDFPELPILILSQYPAEQIAVRAIKAGAACYLNKESAPDELVAAVRALSRHRKYLTDEVADLLATTVRGGGDLPHVTLSNREYEVLRLIASGKTVSEIAAEKNLSVKTVSTYRARILLKMNLSSNAALTSYAVRHGLID